MASSSEPQRVVDADSWQGRHADLLIIPDDDRGPAELVLGLIAYAEASGSIAGRAELLQGDDGPVGLRVGCGDWHAARAESSPLRMVGTRCGWRFWLRAP